MEPAHEIPSLELLLAQEGWVRALARKLVSRESEAEDVAQSALAVALEHPPRSGESVPVLRAWLGQVARRLVIGGHRTESRRLERERRAARAEALPSASEIHAQEEERRIVVEALLALGEPFRTTLLLRYYRGLEPIEIARAMDVPDSTVRNRLARGLAQLKHKLEARRGSDWRAGCALLAGPLVPASKGVLIGKGVVMGVNLKMAISCSVVALAGLAWWGVRGSGTEAPKPAQLEVSSVQKLSSETDKPAEDASNSPALRAKVEPDPSATGATALAVNDPVGILVYGAVREKDGSAPRGTAWLRLLSPEGKEHTSLARAKGAFAFTGLEAGKWKLTATLTGYHEQTVDLLLDNAHPIRRIDLELESRTQIPVRFVTPDGRRLKDALRDLKPAGMGFDLEIGVVASEHELPPTIQESTQSLPAIRTGRLLPDRERQLHRHVSPVDGGRRGPGRRGSLPDVRQRHLAHCRARYPAMREGSGGTRLHDRAGAGPESHRRLPGAAPGCGRPHPLKASLLSLYMRSYGATMGPGPVEMGWCSTHLPPGTVELSLSCPDYERFTEIVDIQPGIVLDLGTRELAPTLPCEVEVVDPAGKPLASIAFCQLDPATLTATRPTEPGGYIATDSAGVLRCRCGPSANWIVPHDSNWTAEPVLLDSGRRSRIVMQHGSELVSTVAATVPDDALLIVRDRNHRCLVIEQARPGFLIRSCLLPGSYEVELVNFSGTLLKKSIELGEKPLVIDLAP
ncbi:MAG: sigma-70 family RNA polymerase sigma factor [Planctomycetes bacterium]|nr:sigma-70 family RNA polymerase sigma factor [Planctomycetota bacterium]